MRFLSVSVLILGACLSVNSSPWVWPVPHPNQDLTIEDARTSMMQPAKRVTDGTVRTSLNSQYLTQNQTNIFTNANRPRMVERTKVIERTRKLPSVGEEQTRVIYRTRIIGSPGMTYSDFNYYDKAFGWPPGSGEDVTIGSGDKFNSFSQKISNLFTPQRTPGSSKDTPTTVQHSTKKDLNAETFPARDAEIFSPGINRGQTLSNNAMNIEDNKQINNIVKAGQDTIDKTFGQQNKFWNIKDSLEIALEERARKRQQNLQNPPPVVGNDRPDLQRQFSKDGVEQTRPISYNFNAPLRSILRTSLNFDGYRMSPLERTVQKHVSFADEAQSKPLQSPIASPGVSQGYSPIRPQQNPSQVVPPGASQGFSPIRSQVSQQAAPTGTFQSDPSVAYPGSSPIRSQAPSQSVPPVASPGASQGYSPIRSQVPPQSVSPSASQSPSSVASPGSTQGSSQAVPPVVPPNNPLGYSPVKSQGSSQVVPPSTSQVNSQAFPPGNPPNPSPLAGPHFIRPYWVGDLLIRKSQPIK